MTNVIAQGEPGMTSSSCSDCDLRGIAVVIPKHVTPAQALHIGSIWKSPRDKRACIEAKIKTFNGGSPFLDLRILELDAAGRMVPTHKGITCSMARLPALAKLVGDAMRKASAAGLLTGASSW